MIKPIQISRIIGYFFIVFESIAVIINPGLAQQTEQCASIRFADSAKPSITAATAATSVIVESLGYSCTTKLMTKSVALQELKNDHIDIFMGIWMPEMLSEITPYTNNGYIQILPPYLIGARYGLCVPSYIYQAGVNSINDINKFKKEFQKRIYGLEPGNTLNKQLQFMIQYNSLLSDWKLIESNEKEMLNAVKKAIDRHEWIVFVGWEPHPMNSMFNIMFLTDTHRSFGNLSEGASICSVVRTKWRDNCPELMKIITNLSFSFDMVNAIMAIIKNQDIDPQTAAKYWLNEHPDHLKLWLQNIKTIDGKEGYQAAIQFIK